MQQPSDLSKRYEEIHDRVMTKLENELPAELTYHNASHTTRVIADASMIAKGEGVEYDGLLLLKTAALFHDTGFLSSSQDHEAHSCVLAESYLPGYGYSREEIGAICKLILSTQLPQSPFDLLSEILCDADLFYLGGDDYERQADRLYQELNTSEGALDQLDWKARQVAFLSSHRYFTKTAQHLQDRGKLNNLRNLTIE